MKKILFAILFLSCYAQLSAAADSVAVKRVETSEDSSKHSDYEWLVMPETKEAKEKNVPGIDFSASYDDDGVLLQFVTDSRNRRKSERLNEYFLEFQLKTGNSSDPRAVYTVRVKLPYDKPILKYGMTNSDSYPILDNAAGTHAFVGADYKFKYFIPWADIQTVLPFADDGTGKVWELNICVEYGNAKINWPLTLKFPNIAKQKVLEMWRMIALQNCSYPVYMDIRGYSDEQFDSLLEITKRLMAQLEALGDEIKSSGSSDIAYLKKQAAKGREIKNIRNKICSSEEILKSASGKEQTLKIAAGKKITLEYVFEKDYASPVFLMNFSVREPWSQDLRITLINGSRTILDDSDTGLLPNNFRLLNSKKGDVVKIIFSAKNNAVSVTPAFTVEEFRSDLPIPKPRNLFNHDDGE